jgi:hypothetical protein
VTPNVLKGVGAIVDVLFADTVLGKNVRVGNERAVMVACSGSGDEVGDVSRLALHPAKNSKIPKIAIR